MSDHACEDEERWKIRQIIAGIDQKRAAWRVIATVFAGGAALFVAGATFVSRSGADESWM